MGDSYNGKGRQTIELFAVRLDRSLTAEERNALLRVMPEERRERLIRTPHAVLSEEPLCAYAALYLMMRTLYGWKVLPRLCYNRYGKPVFADHPAIQFSISHTHRAALVGVHDEPLGVDIERLRPVRKRTMQRLAGTTSSDQFFERWVQREACAKCNGIGLFSVRGNGYRRGNEHLVSLNTFPGYFASLCTCSAAPVLSMRKLVIA